MLMPQLHTISPLNGNYANYVKSHFELLFICSIVLSGNIVNSKTHQELLTINSMKSRHHALKGIFVCTLFLGLYKYLNKITNFY